MTSATSPRVEVNLAACQGYANCMVGAPEVFDLSDAGKVVLLEVDLATVDPQALEDAVASCPAAALRLIEGA